MGHVLDRSSQRTRRAFLRTTAVGVGVAATGVAALSDAGLALAGSTAEEVATILALGTTAEAVAATFSDAALRQATFHIDEAARAHLEMALQVDRQHLLLLQEQGGHMLQQDIYLPRRALVDAGAFVRTGRAIDAIRTRLYLGAVHQLAELDRPHLAATMAQLGASAAQHWALLSHLAGLPPCDHRLLAPAFGHVSEALPALAPFLTERRDRVGPLGVLLAEA